MDVVSDPFDSEALVLETGVLGYGFEGETGEAKDVDAVAGFVVR